jgi:hypothetical protein
MSKEVMSDKVEVPLGKLHTIVQVFNKLLLVLQLHNADMMCFKLLSAEIAKYHQLFTYVIQSDDDNL